MSIKIKDKIRSRVRDWLGVDEIDNRAKEASELACDSIELHTKASGVHGTIKSILKDHDNILKSLCDKTNDIKTKSNNHSKRIASVEDTLASVVSVGVDHYPSERTGSWAVVCIEGNVNIVKFTRLDYQEMRELLRFLKSHEVSRQVVDSPYNYFGFNDEFSIKF